jgi:hypothetical protein
VVGHSIASQLHFFRPDNDIVLKQAQLQVLLEQVQQ